MTKQPSSAKVVHTLVHCVLVVALAAPIFAHALVGGAGPDPNTANSPWAGVGSLNVGGQQFTAAVIAPGYVLTAAHVLVGSNPKDVSFQLNAGTAESVAATQIFFNPSYTGTTAGNVSTDPTVHADLAIVRLASTTSVGVPNYGLYAGNLLGQDLSFVSYAGSSTTKRTGENTADVVFADAAGLAQTYLFDFDGPDLSTNRLGFNTPTNGTLGANREASLIGGDSGSSAFIQVQGQWQLAGVNTFQASFGEGPATGGAFGTGGGGVVVSSYAPWINRVIATAVPEPQIWAMLMAGLLLTTFGGARRQQPADLTTPCRRWPALAQAQH